MSTWQNEKNKWFELEILLYLHWIMVSDDGVWGDSDKKRVTWDTLIKLKKHERWDSCFLSILMVLWHFHLFPPIRERTPRWLFPSVESDNFTRDVVINVKEAVESSNKHLVGRGGTEEAEDAEVVSQPVLLGRPLSAHSSLGKETLGGVTYTWQFTLFIVTVRRSMERKKEWRRFVGRWPPGVQPDDNFTFTDWRWISSNFFRFFLWFHSFPSRDSVSLTGTTEWPKEE